MAQPAITIDRAAYADRLHAMWLGECIANWTGLRTEGARINPPFFTDTDWGTTPASPPGMQRIDFVLNQDPWLADDDTDVEYVYLHAMSQLGRCALSPPEIRQAWLDHMDPNWIWVSDRRAYDLMQRGVLPPQTGSSAANQFWAAIDAQLTTEFFGALCPGMPDEALRYADLPIRTTADGFAIHAAQFYVVLYSLATRVDPTLSGKDKALWLVRTARRSLPDTSKSADIVDTVLADFEANPDLNNWERTRDLIYERYHGNASAHGFAYRGWTESSVNFASGVMCLLYGQCDYKRTVQIGTLSGWDSDNCTATMGGLLGLMLGYDALRAQFPGQAFSDRFNIHRTRINLPDYLPADPEADDTLTLMAQRMLPLIDSAITTAGGSIDTQANCWRLPPSPLCKPVEANAGQRARRQSANNRVRLDGGTVTVTSPGPSSPWGPVWVYGHSDPANIASGRTADFAGLDITDTRLFFFSTQGSGHAAGTIETLEVHYDRPVQAAVIRFIEGDHFGTPGSGSAPNGGWFDSVEVQVQVAGVWTTPAATQSQPLDAARPFQCIDFTLAAPVLVTGIRVRGPCGGADGFITCTQLDALASPVPLVRMDAHR